MSVFTGAGVAIITPMKANGEVNYEKLGEFIDYQIENSTDAIVICGTTGEASTLTHEEHIETIRFAADHVKKRVPVRKQPYIFHRKRRKQAWMPVWL